MNPGDRVRMVGSPWPEREGCEGVVVAPPADGTYPQPAAWERVVLLDDDPLFDPNPGPFGASVEQAKVWTCVTSASRLEYA